MDGPEKGAQIYGSYWIPDPPARSAFNGGGGGPELVITSAHIWTALKRALTSTAQNGFRTPPSVLPLMEGGGVRN
jgi:hypothetical protein